MPDADARAIERLLDNAWNAMSRDNERLTRAAFTRALLSGAALAYAGHVSPGSLAYSADAETAVQRAARGFAGELRLALGAAGRAACVEVCAEAKTGPDVA
jgi:hypothetical protein